MVSIFVMGGHLRSLDGLLVGALFLISRTTSLPGNQCIHCCPIGWTFIQPSHCNSLLSIFHFLLFTFCLMGDHFSVVVLCNTHFLGSCSLLFLVHCFLSTKLLTASLHVNQSALQLHCEVRLRIQWTANCLFNQPICTALWGLPNQCTALWGLTNQCTAIHYFSLYCSEMNCSATVNVWSSTGQFFFLYHCNLFTKSTAASHHIKSSELDCIANMTQFSPSLPNHFIGAKGISLHCKLQNSKTFFLKKWQDLPVTQTLTVKRQFACTGTAVSTQTTRNVPV